jgi:hypothetical protein
MALLIDLIDDRFSILEQLSRAGQRCPMSSGAACCSARRASSARESKRSPTQRYWQGIDEDGLHLVNYTDFYSPQGGGSKPLPSKQDNVRLVAMTSVNAVTVVMAAIA